MGVWCLSVPSGRFASCQKTGPGTNTVATGAHAPWMVGAYLRVGFAGGCPFGEGRDLIILGGGSEIRGVLRADAQGLIQIAEAPYRVVGRVDEGGDDACACADVGLRGGSRIINDSTGSTEFLFLLYSIVLVTIHSFAASLRCTVRILLRALRSRAAGVGRSPFYYSTRRRMGFAFAGTHTRHHLCTRRVPPSPSNSGPGVSGTRALNRLLPLGPPRPQPSRRCCCCHYGLTPGAKEKIPQHFGSDNGASVFWAQQISGPANYFPRRAPYHRFRFPWAPPPDQSQAFLLGSCPFGPPRLSVCLLSAVEPPPGAEWVV